MLRPDQVVTYWRTLLVGLIQELFQGEHLASWRTWSPGNRRLGGQRHKAGFLICSLVLAPQTYTQQLLLTYANSAS